MPEGAADIEVVFRPVLEQECDRQIGDKADEGDEHDPAAGNRDRSQDALGAHDRDADGSEQQDKGVEECGHDAGPVIPEGPAVGGGARRQDVRV